MTKWGFEVFEMFRKLITTCVLVFIPEAGRLRIAMGFIIMFTFLIVTILWKPFADTRLEKMQIWALLVLCVSLFYGVMLKADQVRPLLELYNLTQECHGAISRGTHDCWNE